MKKEDGECLNLKVALVGCGTIAKVHQRYVTRYIRRDAIALCDRDEVRLEDFARQSGLTRSFTDMDEMFRRFKPDIVHVLTPPSTHREIAVKCLENGSHVLIEKPMCLSEKEADDIIAAAGRCGRMVCVDHLRLFDPQVMKVKELLRSGALGEVVNVTGCYSHDILARLGTDSRERWAGSLRGGMLFDVAPHLVYILEDLLPGLECRETISKKNAVGTVTDMISVFSAPSGTGTVRLSLNVFPLQNFIEIECTAGVVKIDLRNFVTTVRRKSRLPGAVERIAGNVSVGMQTLAGTAGSLIGVMRGRLDPYAGLHQIIRQFYGAAVNGGESPVPAEKGKALARLTDAMFPAPAETPSLSVKEETALPPANILVTGGTGFIGKRLIARLSDKGSAVRVLTRRDSVHPALRWRCGRNVRFVVGDVYNYRDVEKACRGVKTVYHLAAAMKGDWNYFLDTTVSGTKNIMKGALAAGVRHLVYVSTLNVLAAADYPHNGTIDEDFPWEDMPEKRGNYSHAKLRAEKIALHYKDDPRLSLSIIRPGLVYGPGGPAFPADVGFRLGKKAVVTPGMGTRKLPLVYIENLVDALVLAGEAGEKARGIFNVVDGEYPRQRQYARMYKRISGERFVTFYIPMSLLLAGAAAFEKLSTVFLKKNRSFGYRLRCVNRNVVHDTGRIEKALGWKQRVSFEEGLAATVGKRGAVPAASAAAVRGI